MYIKKANKCFIFFLLCCLHVLEFFDIVIVLVVDEKVEVVEYLQVNLSKLDVLE